MDYHYHHYYHYCHFYCLDKLVVILLPEQLIRIFLPAHMQWSGWENRRGPSLWFSIPALLPIWSVMLINKWANKNSNHNSFTRHPICNPPGKPISGWPVRTIQFFFFFFLIKFHCPFPLPHTYLAVPGLCIWDLVPWPGIKLWPPALGAWSLSHWTTRDVP